MDESHLTLEFCGQGSHSAKHVVIRSSKSWAANSDVSISTFNQLIIIIIIFLQNNNFVDGRISGVIVN